MKREGRGMSSNTYLISIHVVMNAAIVGNSLRHFVCTCVNVNTILCVVWRDVSNKVSQNTAIIHGTSCHDDDDDALSLSLSLSLSFSLSLCLSLTVPGPKIFRYHDRGKLEID